MRTDALKISLVTKHATPLCILPSGKLVYYKHGVVSIWNGSEVEKEITIPTSFRESSVARVKLLHRLLRLGVRAAIAIDENVLLLSISNYVYELNLSTGHLSKGYFCGSGIRPLSFALIESLSSFPKGVYFGGYLSNMAKKPVAIYHRIEEDKWEEVFLFPAGEINHVHCIVEDPYRDCIWIFTGDFDKASAIWKAENNFSKVTRLVSNNQIYRGCVSFPIKEGLLYATDTPFADNYICLLNLYNKCVSRLQVIQGSCIYGCHWKDRYVFSTTIEGDGRKTSKLEFLFGRKNGLGIKDHEVHLYIGNVEDGFEDIFQLKKDLMPYYTFQFGAFKFPYGFNSTPHLYFQPIATSRHDLDLLQLNLPENS